MEPPSIPQITSAVAPVVMVSAAGLLFIGVQTKNLHLADRIRTLATEYRVLPDTPVARERRAQIADQLALFERRVRLSQRALEFLYVAIVCFVLTSLLLASTPWLGGFVETTAVAGIFVVGVAFLLTALVVELLEMRVGLSTVRMEIEATLGGRRGNATD